MSRLIAKTIENFNLDLSIRDKTPNTPLTYKNPDLEFFSIENYEELKRICGVLRMLASSYQVTDEDERLVKKSILDFLKHKEVEKKAIEYFLKSVKKSSYLEKMIEEVVGYE